MSGRRGFLFFIFVVFGLWNANASHDDTRQVAAAITGGTFRLTPASALAAARAYLNNEGDVRRYYAYSRAALGRPYSPYYVRSAAEWRRSFAAHEDPDPDTFPDVSPARPLVPYRDFLVEYPPGFFLFTLPLAALTDDFERFQRLFASAMGLCLLASLLLAAGLAGDLGLPGRSAGRLVGWGGLGALLLGVMTTHRYDAAVALLLVGMCRAGVRRQPARFGLLLGLAIAVKLTPLLFALPWLLGWLRRRELRALVVVAMVTAATLALFALPALVGAGPGMLDTLAYHRDRPLQIESTAGALFALLGGRSVSMVYTFGSFNLLGPHLGAALALSSLATLGGLAGGAAITWRRLGRLPSEARAQAEGRLLVAATAALLSVFMVTGKVLSPQYLVWLLPFFVLLSVGDRLALGLFVAVAALTQVIYPIGYGMMLDLRPPLLLVGLLRNGLLLGWGCHVFLRPLRPTPAG